MKELEEWGQWKRSQVYGETMGFIKMDLKLKTLRITHKREVDIITEIYVFQWSVKKISKSRGISQYSVKVFETKVKNMIRRALQ